MRLLPKQIPRAASIDLGDIAYQFHLPYLAEASAKIHGGYISSRKKLADAVSEMVKGSANWPRLQQDTGGFQVRGWPVATEIICPVALRPGKAKNRLGDIVLGHCAGK